MYIDHSVYPDLDVPPDDLPTDFDKADYLHRICSAADFGVLPDPHTFDLLRDWKQIFDAFPVLTSPTYHALRQRFGWNPLPWPPNISPPPARWEQMDRIEGRSSDPCERLI